MATSAAPQPGMAGAAMRQAASLALRARAASARTSASGWSLSALPDQVAAMRQASPPVLRSLTAWQAPSCVQERATLEFLVNLGMGGWPVVGYVGEEGMVCGEGKGYQERVSQTESVWDCRSLWKVLELALTSRVTVRTTRSAPS